ncbi:hypothetical protein KKE60_07180 [Patescibacteria group bacterium]|nr:hypothetical protein [Patescibacteria group bacterium]
MTLTKYRRYDFDAEWEQVQPSVALAPRPSSSVVVASYEGVLCTVTTEVPPDYKLIQHTEYPRGKTYVGKAEQCTFEFKLYPEQIPGVSWLGIKIANAFADQVVKQDAEMLDLKVYEDTTPMLWTNYRVVATATASPVYWAIIIVAVLAILFIVAIIFLIREVKTIDWGKPAEAVIPILAIILGIGAVAGLGIMLTRKK